VFFLIRKRETMDNKLVPEGSIEFHGAYFSPNATYLIAVEHDLKEKVDTLYVKFGPVSAQNDQLVREANDRVKKMVDSGQLAGGTLLKINGPASLPLAVTISHGVLHLYEAIAVYDPKISPPYVISVTHGLRYKVGDRIE